MSRNSTPDDSRSADDADIIIPPESDSGADTDGFNWTETPPLTVNEDLDISPEARTAVNTALQFLTTTKQFPFLAVRITAANDAATTYVTHGAELGQYDTAFHAPTEDTTGTDDATSGEPNPALHWETTRHEPLHWLFKQLIDRFHGEHSITVTLIDRLVAHHETDLAIFDESTLSMQSRNRFFDPYNTRRFFELLETEPIYDKEEAKHRGRVLLDSVGDVETNN